MFSNLIFLVIVLLLTSFSPMGNGNDWIVSPSWAFFLGCSLYAFVIGTIILSTKLFRSRLPQAAPPLLALTNISLIFFLIIFHFFLAAQRPYADSLAVNTIVSLLFYFGGLLTFHTQIYDKLPSGQRGTSATGIQYGLNQLRLTIPFALPYVFYTIIIDITKWIPSLQLHQVLMQKSDDPTSTVVLFILTLFFLVIMLLFFPPILQFIWKCRPLRNLDLLQRLEKICQIANFRHAGIKTWTVMNHSYTAGIIGVLPRFRYVMFTQRLLDELSPEATEAVLAHEIGHSYRKHLLIYPFIIFGMIVIAGLFSLVFTETIDEAFALRNALNPSPLWQALYPLAIFLPYAAIVIIYFRIVFGYFSRLFERQADLHVFELGIPAKAMQEALDTLGVLTGNTHHHPSWHHHGIQKRIDFLTEAERNPTLIFKHHRRVKRNIIGYLLILSFLTVPLIAPSVRTIPPFLHVNQMSQTISESLSNGLNADLQNKLAVQYWERFELSGNQEKVLEALEKSIQNYIAVAPEGIVLYAAARDLYADGELDEARQLLEISLQQLKKEPLNEELLQEIEALLIL